MARITKDTQTRWPTKMIVFGVAALLAGGVSIGLARSKDHKVSTLTAHTQGTVVSTRWTYQTRRSGGHYRSYRVQQPEVVFAAPDGSPRSFWGHGYRSESVTVGQHVQVDYDPHNPSHAEQDEDVTLTQSGDSIRRDFGWIFIGLGALLTLFGLVAGAVVGFVKPPRDVANRQVPQPAPAPGFGAPPFPTNGASQQYGPNPSFAGFGHAPSGTNLDGNFGPAPGYGAPVRYSQQTDRVQPPPYSPMPQAPAPRDAYGQAPYSQPSPANYPPAPTEPQSGPRPGPTAPLPRSVPLPRPKKTSD